MFMMMKDFFNKMRMKDNSTQDSPEQKVVVERIENTRPEILMINDAFNRLSLEMKLSNMELKKDILDAYDMYCIKNRLDLIEQKVKELEEA